MNSVIDEKFTLHDLLDPAVLREVCEAFANCFSLGVMVLGVRGERIIAETPKNEFCLAKQQAAGNGKCEEVIQKMAAHPLESSRVFQTRAFCGLRYAIFPVFYEFETMGRVILGPFQDPERDEITPPDSRNQADDGSKPCSAPAIFQPQLKQIIRLLSRCLDAYLFINAKRLMTMRLHLETIHNSREAIFRDFERQSQQTPEDKEEIKKLKDLF